MTAESLLQEKLIKIHALGILIFIEYNHDNESKYSVRKNKTKESVGINNIDFSKIFQNNFARLSKITNFIIFVYLFFLNL